MFNKLKFYIIHSEDWGQVVFYIAIKWRRKELLDSSYFQPKFKSNCLILKFWLFTIYSTLRLHFLSFLRCFLFFTFEIVQHNAMKPINSSLKYLWHNIALHFNFHFSNLQAISQKNMRNQGLIKNPLPLPPIKFWEPIRKLYTTFGYFLTILLSGRKERNEKLSK